MFPIHDDNQRLHGRPYVNYALIFINIIVFIWEIAITDFFTNEVATTLMLLNFGAIPILILHGDIPSLFTSMFMHAGVAHIVGNMVFLFVFGDNIEDRFGHIKYLLIYLMWGIVASYVHSLYVVEVLGMESGLIPAVGASGAISGILGAYLLMSSLEYL
jgi:membrane associated rhomboid family serine protease